MDKPKKASVALVREAFMVRRFHTVAHVHKEETVGHHTAGVLALLFYLFDDAPPLYLIRHALHHDVPEAITGDLPATAKWKFPALAKAAKEAEAQIVEAAGLEQSKLDPLHRDLLKYADMMDLCFKAVEELAFGNEAFGQVLANGLNYCQALLKGTLKDHQNAHALYVILHDNKFINIREFQLETEHGTRH